MYFARQGGGGTGRRVRESVGARDREAFYTVENGWKLL
jgi:hypothetical protein